MCFYQSGGGTRGAVEGMQASQFYLCCCKCLLCLSPLCSLKSRCPWFACVPLGATVSVHSVPRVHGSLLSRKLPVRAGLPRQPPGSPIFPVMASTVQQGPWTTWSKAHPLPVTSTSHAGRKQEGQKVLGRVQAPTCSSGCGFRESGSSLPWVSRSRCVPHSCVQASTGGAEPEALL